MNREKRIAGTYDNDKIKRIDQINFAGKKPDGISRGKRARRNVALDARKGDKQSEYLLSAGRREGAFNN